jgi:hypothetical protein
MEQAAMDAIAAGMIVFAASLRNRRAPNHPHANLPSVMQWDPISCHRHRPTLGLQRWTRMTCTVGANVPGGESRRLLNGREVPGDCWRLFGSRQLRTLTERALKNCADIATAQAALRVA